MEKDTTIKNLPSEYYLANIVVVAVYFLFFLQSMTNLVESIYLLDLLNTQLDEKVIGLLFFFSTFLVLFMKAGSKENLIKLSAIGITIFRILYPNFSPTIKLVFAGIAVGCAMIFFPLFMFHQIQYKFKNPVYGHSIGYIYAFGIGVATLISIFLRTMKSSLDISEYGNFQLIAWVFAVFAILAIFYILKIESEINENQISSNTQVEEGLEKNRGSSSIFNILGIFCIFTLIYFGYGSPAVFTRWTETNYSIVLSIISISVSSFLIILILKPQILSSVPIPFIIIANLVFFTSLIAVILVNQVEFISSSSNSPVFVESIDIKSYILLYLNLAFTPILFIDVLLIVQSLMDQDLTLNQISKSFLVSELFLVILIFITIFTNVWGYVDPISPIFRGLFWLPFLILGSILIFTVTKVSKHQITVLGSNIINYDVKRKIIASIIIVILCLSIPLVAFSLSRVEEPSGTPSSIRVMTFNIQQGANVDGEKNLENQLQLISDLNPDIIGLQESDITKINTGNDDAVRFFADSLGYYHYYGPRTVMQTYGVALLSRYPIMNTRTFYTSGDVDEIGSIQAVIKIGLIKLNIFVNHPAGNNNSKLDHTTHLLELADGLSNVIMMGDFNWNETTQFYTMVTANYRDTWRTLWPSGVTNDGLDMSITIDHIFVSTEFSVFNGMYIPSPDSQTDHPVYWTNLSI